MTPEDYAIVARDFAESEVDRLISIERDPEARARLLLHRKQIVDKLVDCSVIADLKRRLDAVRVRDPEESIH